MQKYFIGDQLTWYETFVYHISYIEIYHPDFDNNFEYKKSFYITGIGEKCRILEAYPRYN